MDFLGYAEFLVFFCCYRKSGIDRGFSFVGLGLDLYFCLCRMLILCIFDILLRLFYLKLRNNGFRM